MKKAYYKMQKKKNTELVKLHYFFQRIKVLFKSTPK